MPRAKTFFSQTLAISPATPYLPLYIFVLDPRMLECKRSGCALDADSFVLHLEMELLSGAPPFIEINMVGPSGELINIVPRLCLEGERTIDKALDPRLFVPGIQTLHVNVLRGTRGISTARFRGWIEVVWRCLCS